jgi:hypothetical protein
VGVGQRKVQDLGPSLVEKIRAYCTEHDLAMDVLPSPARGPASAPAARRSPPGPVLRRAFELFAKGESIERVMEACGRARSTTVQYLERFIEERRPADVSAWVDAATLARAAPLIRKLGPGLTPIFQELGGEVSYDSLRIIRAHLR